MIERDPIEDMFHRYELTGHVVDTDDGGVRVIVEDSDPSQLGTFFEALTNTYAIDVSHDDHYIYILIRTFPESGE